MHLEVLVEESSAEAVVRRVVAAATPATATYEVRVFDGKTDLLGSLPDRLRGYRSWAIDGLRIMVLVDRDTEDCLQLKSRLEALAHGAGFTTRTSANSGSFEVCNRIAVEELEAWFLGDEPALRAAFPRLKPFAAKAQYRDPDKIAGAWETAERLLQRASYYQAGLRKRDLSLRVAPLMNIGENRSASFATFVSGLTSLMAE